MSDKGIKRWTSGAPHVKKIGDYIDTETADRKNLKELIDKTFVIEEVRKDFNKEYGDFLVLMVDGVEYNTFSWVLQKQMMDFLKRETLPVQVTLRWKRSQRTGEFYYCFE